MSRKIKSIIIFFILILSIIVILPTKMVFAAQTSGLDNNKVYHLINKASGKCLNVNYGTDANGTNVNQYTKDGSREQYFKLCIILQEIHINYMQCAVQMVEIE